MHTTTRFLSLFRFQLIAALIFGVLVEHSVLSQSAPATFTRELMLHNLGSNVLASGWGEITARCRELTNCLGQLVDAPNQLSLDTARAAWLAAAQASARMRCFQSGPIAERDWTSTFNYWKVLPDRIQGVLHSSSNSVDQAFLDNLGCETKGLFAIESLLFQQVAPASTNQNVPPILAALAGQNRERTRSFLLALGREVANQATAIAHDWNSLDASGAQTKFVNGGQQSINLLVNQLAACLEDVSENHLHFVLVLPKPISRQLYRVERSRSGSSLEGVLATLEGAQKLFQGGGGLGLRDAVRQVNPELEKRIADQFDATIGCVRALGAPLEQVVVKNRPALENAYQKARALEVLIKVDVASALGVTLTFSSSDGD
jgi:predicted lipoprotein